MKNRTKALVAAIAALASLLGLSCGSIKQFETPQQALNAPLTTYVGGTIFKLKMEESLPNALGRADVYGGRRPTGFVELKYLGPGEDGAIKLRVVTADTQTNENWRRRLGRDGHATTTTDHIDFEHDSSQPFEMEGYSIIFETVASSSISFRIERATP